MAGRKKTFTEDLNNPALSFLSDPEEKKPAAAEVDPEADEQLNRLKAYAEQLGYTMKQAGKTRRCQIVMTEALYNAARERIAGEIDPITNRPLSFNQYISNLVSADVNQAAKQE